MAAPVLGTAGTATQALGVTQLTIPFTLAAGETLFVMVNGGAAVLPTVSSAVWNGSEAMTLIGAATAGNAFRSCHVFGLVGATTGTHDVVVTFGASVNAALGVAFSYSNVNVVTPWDSVQTANGNPSTTPSVTMASATGDLAVACFLGSEAYVSWTATNGTKQTEQTTANGSFILLDRAGQTSTQINGTLGFSDTWGLVGFNLNASVDVQTLPVTNANLFFSPYNTYSDGAGAMASTNIKASSTYALMANTGAYLKFKVTVAAASAGIVALTLDTTAYNGLNAASCPTISVSYDKGLPVNTLLSYSASAVTLTLASGLAAGTYEFMVRFKSIGGTAGLGSGADRWTTPKYAIKITGIIIDTSASIPAQTIGSGDWWLIYGASYSEGINVTLAENDSANDLVNAYNDAGKSFGALMARGLGVEYGIVAYGGQGVARGIGNAAASSTNPSFYNATAANQSWDKYSSGKSRTITSPEAPAVVWIDQGFNDTGLSAASVTAVIDAIRTAVGTSAWIFWVTQNSDDDAAIATGVANAASTAKTKLLAVTDLVIEGDPSEYSSDAAFGSSHPNLLGQALRATQLLEQAIDYIESGSGGGGGGSGGVSSMRMGF